MPLTQLDSTAALIVIDLQKGITGFTAELGSADVVSRSAALAKAFSRTRAACCSGERCWTRAGTRGPGIWKPRLSAGLG